MGERGWGERGEVGEREKRGEETGGRRGERGRERGGGGREAGYHVNVTDFRPIIRGP